jgi:hypothetical protein
MVNYNWSWTIKKNDNKQCHEAIITIDGEEKIIGQCNYGVSEEAKQAWVSNVFHSLKYWVK